MSILKFDLGTIDIGAPGSTIPISLEENYCFSVAPVVTGTAGTAKYTVRVSQDNVNYFDYKTSSTNVPITSAIMENVSLPWKWLKLDIVNGGPSTGSAQFGILLKRV